MNRDTLSTCTRIRRTYRILVLVGTTTGETRTSAALMTPSIDGLAGLPESGTSPECLEEPEVMVHSPR